jgi:tetratricopeptide (TPR) repeat protein
MAVQHNLAVLTRQGKHAEALKMYGQLVDARSRQQGDDHQDTWSARHNYAVVLNALGRVTEAEKGLTQVLEGCRRADGPRHSTTLGVQVDLAATKANQGRTREAVPLLRDAIDGYRSTHGPNHPRVRLEVAGAVGLVFGLASAPLGVAAAIGLALLMTVAAVVHLRHGDPPVRALPAAVLALTAVAYAGVAVGTG